MSDVLQRQLAVRGRTQDGGGERMLARLFQTGTERQHRGFIEIRSRHDRRDARSALGEGAGLVDHQGIDLLEALQRFRVLDEHAGAGSFADAGHDGHGGCETERTGTGDDEHGHGGNHCEAERRRRRPHHPGGEGQDRGGQDRRNEPGSHRIGEALDRRPGCAAHPATICTIRDSRVSAPIFSAVITSAPVPLMEPPMTFAPTALATGVGSPVTIDSSTALVPSATAPSTGTASPGRTRSRSPTWT